MSSSSATPSFFSFNKPSASDSNAPPAFTFSAASTAPSSLPKKEKSDTLKVLLVGDGGCGKTSFADRHLLGSLNKRRLDNLGINIHPMDFMANIAGIVYMDVWDYNASVNSSEENKEFYAGAKAAIVMFDLTVAEDEAKDQVSRWKKTLAGRCGEDVPIVVCGNKLDLVQGDLSTKDASYIETCALSNLNFNEVFTSVIRLHTRNTQETLLVAPALCPPGVVVPEKK